MATAEDRLDDLRGEEAEKKRVGNALPGKRESRSRQEGPPLLPAHRWENDVDLDGEGLEHNFDLVKDRFGATVHVREFNGGSYPYPDLMRLFLKMKYEGWILLEARTNPKDKVAALVEQRKLFERMTTQ